MAKTIFITGASRGLGRIWTEAFLKRGDQVVAAVRNPNSLDELAEEYPSSLFVLPLDVTDKSACFDAVAKAKARFGTLDVLINNAGYGHMGTIEELEESEVRLQLDTNLLGLLWVTQAVIPLMREQQSGHIVQISSALGLVTVPTMGIYSASKWAVEGLSEALASEVSGFGIHVTIVEPNGFSTEFATASVSQSKPMAIYDDVRSALYAAHQEEASGVPEATAAAMLQLVDSENPPLRMFLGKVGFPWVRQAYESRLATWEEWQEVSASAHGK